MNISQTLDKILCPKLTYHFTGLICVTDICLLVLQKLSKG
jgi:hypothetical protein